MASSQSPFLNLPQEIRDMIYSLLISRETIYIGRRKVPPHHCHGIILASKQTHRETIELFYRTSVFAIASENVKDGLEWIVGLPDRYRDLLSRIIFLRSARYIDTYSMIRMRALGDAAHREFLLEPLVRNLEEKGIIMREGVLAAEYAVW